MPTIISPSTLSSLIKYLQSISLTLGIPADNLPEKLTIFAESLNNFFNKIWDYIPHVPDFDVRVRIVLLCFAIPTLLDLLFTWFTSYLSENIFHLLDIAASFALLFEIGYIIMSNGVTITSIFVVIPVCVIYLVVRLVLLIRKIRHRNKNTESLIYLVDRIKNFYMKGIIPGIESDDTEDDMQNMLKEYNESYVFKIVEPSVLNISFILVCMAILSVIISYCLNAFGNFDVKPFVKITIIIFCSFMLIVLLIVLIMIVFPCLREPFVSFRTFVRRYGVKLLMLILDFLYIPVGTAILENLRYQPDTCGDGFYRHFNESLGSFDLFLDHNFYCLPCSSSSPSCLDLCHKHDLTYSTSSPQLTFMGDILQTVGPMLAFAFLGIIIGQPVLTLFVVLNNKAIAWSIPVFGQTAEAKWSTLVDKLSTTGLFNFYMFKYNLSGWAIYTSIQKLVFIVLTEIAERVNIKISYAILVLYIFLFVCYLYFQPFTFLFNNVLEIVMAFANAALTIVPICSAYGKNVPSWFSIPLSVIICAIPIIAIPYAFCRKSMVRPEPDPGTVYDEDGKPTEPENPSEKLFLHMIDLMALWQIVDLEKSGGKIYPEPLNEDSFDSFCDGDYITVSRDLLLDRIYDMYALIDKVCDATTTLRFLSTIKIAVMISAACSGWFFGAIFGKKELFNNTIC